MGKMNILQSFPHTFLLFSQFLFCVLRSASILPFYALESIASVHNCHFKFIFFLSDNRCKFANSLCMAVAFLIIYHKGIGKMYFSHNLICRHNFYCCFSVTVGAFPSYNRPFCNFHGIVCPIHCCQNSGCSYHCVSHIC